jgi:tetratricopeptide (TPR) repeat protein
MKSLLILVTMVFALGCKNEADDLYQQAMVLFESGDYSRTMEILDQALTHDPDHADAYVTRASCKLNLNDYKGAVEDYSMGIALVRKKGNPLPTVYYNRGEAYYRLENFDSAYQDFTTAISLDTTFADAYYARGNVWYNTGGLDSARSDYEKSILLNPQLAAGYFGLGNVYSDNNHDLAIELYSQAINLQADADYFFNRGLMYYLQAEYPEAINDFTDAIKINNQLAKAYEFRGNANDENGSSAEALKDFDQAILIDPTNGSVFFNRGITKKNNGDDEGACSDFRKALELGYVEALVKTGDCP